MAILPIYTYDDPVLRKKCEPVEESTDELQQLIDDMFETMYNAQGVGLAAPQIGETIRLFVMDADPMIEEDDEETELGKLTLINPEIVSTGDDEIELEEGCLSIPEVRSPISRPDTITVRYRDREFNQQTMTVSGWVSRVIQHETDHLDGVLFLEYISSFKKRLMRSKLRSIDNGEFPADYPLVPKQETVSK